MLVSSPDSYPLDVDASRLREGVGLLRAVVLRAVDLRVLRFLVLGGSSGSSKGALAADEGRAAFRALRVATMSLNAAVQR